MAEKEIELKCPKCNAPLEDWSGVDEWGWYEDEPFRCSGHLIEPRRFPRLSEYNPLNRTKPCGYFSKADLGEKNDGA